MAIYTMRSLSNQNNRTDTGSGSRSGSDTEYESGSDDGGNDNGTETDTDTDTYDQILEDEKDLRSPRRNGGMYIGLTTYDQAYRAFIMASTVHAQTLYKYNPQDVLRYLYEYNVSRRANKTVDIMQLHMVPNTMFGATYEVVIKTHWLRLVQRRWRRVFQERQRILRERVHPGSRRVVELRGTYPVGTRYLPGLRGMLHDLVNTTTTVQNWI